MPMTASSSLKSIDANSSNSTHERATNSLAKHTVQLAPLVSSKVFDSTTNASSTDSQQQSATSLSNATATVASLISPKITANTSMLAEGSFIRSLFTGASDDSVAVMMPSPQAAEDDDADDGQQSADDDDNYDDIATSATQANAVDDDDATAGGIEHVLAETRAQASPPVALSTELTPSASLQLSRTEMSKILTDQEAPGEYKERENFNDGVLVGEEQRVPAESHLSSSRGFGLSGVGFRGFNPASLDYGFNPNARQFSALEQESDAQSLQQAGFGPSYGPEYGNNQQFQQRFGGLQQDMGEFNQYNTDTGYNTNAANFDESAAAPYNGGGGGFARSGIDYSANSAAGFNGASTQWDGSGYGNPYSQFNANNLQRLSNADVGGSRGGFSSRTSFNPSNANAGFMSGYQQAAMGGSENAFGPEQRSSGGGLGSPSVDDMPEPGRLYPLSPVVPLPNEVYGASQEEPIVEKPVSTSSNKMPSGFRTAAGLLALTRDQQLQYESSVRPSGYTSANDENNSESDDDNNNSNSYSSSGNNSNNMDNNNQSNDDESQQTDESETQQFDDGQRSADFRSTQIPASGGPSIEFARSGSAGYLQPKMGRLGKQRALIATGQTQHQAPFYQERHRGQVEQSDLSSRSGHDNPAHAGKFFVE